MQQRPLKFMAWHKPTSKLFPVYTLNDDFVWEHSLDGPGTSETLPAERADCILIQFSGITDMKGNEIYEGHIIMTSVPDSGEPKGRAIYYNEIGFRNGAFGLISELDREKFISFVEVDIETCINDAEIVGNIFEHKSLVAGDMNEDDVWNADRYKDIPDVRVICSGNLTNFIEWQDAFIKMQKADHFLNTSIEATDWKYLRDVYFDQDVKVKEAFEDMFYE